MWYITLELSKRFKEFNGNLKEFNCIGINCLDCPFCDTTKSKDRCLIYPIRPWICRMFHCDYVDNELRVSNHNLRVKREVVNMQVLFGRGNNDKRR